MDTKWVQGHKDKDARVAKVRGYRPALNELKEILEKHYKKNECVRDYDTPNWEYRQIAVNEYNQVLDDIIKLITIKD